MSVGNPYWLLGFNEACELCVSIISIDAMLRNSSKLFYICEFNTSNIASKCTKEKVEITVESQAMMTSNASLFRSNFHRRGRFKSHCCQGYCFTRGLLGNRESV